MQRGDRLVGLLVVRVQRAQLGDERRVFDRLLLRLVDAIDREVELVPLVADDDLEVGGLVRAHRRRRSWRRARLGDRRHDRAVCDATRLRDWLHVRRLANVNPIPHRDSVGRIEVVVELGGFHTALPPRSRDGE